MKLKNFRPNNISKGTEELKKLYRATDLKFPYSLEQFYLATNGGRFCTYVVKNEYEPWLSYPLFEYYFDLCIFYSIDDILEKYEYLKEEAMIYLDITNKAFYLNYMLPITDVNDNCICVCCKGEDTGKIYLVEWISSQSQGILPLPQQLIANSFEELLEKMVLEEDDEEYQRLIRM